VTTFSADEGDEPVETTSTYEPLYNQVKSSTDARGGETTYDYGFVSPRARGNPIRATFPMLERPDGSMVNRPPESYEYNADAQRVSTNAGNGLVTGYRYNNRGYLQGINYPSGASLDYQLSDRGEILRESGTSATVSYKRDGLGRMTEKIIDPGGANVRSTYRYDLNGNTLEVHSFIRDIFNPSSAKMAGITAGPELDRSVTTTYDALGRVLSETVTAGRLSTVTKNEYDNLGALVAKTVPALSGDGTTTSRFAYDARGKVISTIEAADTPVALTTKITHDINGNETQVQVSGGSASATAVNTYDGFDRLVSSQSPLGAETKYEYEPGGKPTLVELSGSKGPGAGSGMLKRTTSEYDVYGNLIRRAVDTLVDGSEESFWFYNDRLLVERFVAPNGGETRFEYDRDNRVTKVIDPAGNETVTTYNRRGQATRIAQTVTEQVADAKTGNTVERKRTYTTNQEFDALGHAVSMEGPAVNQRFFYNSADQMRGFFSAGEGLTTFTYDGLGRRESIRNGDNFELTSHTPGGLVRETDGLISHQVFEYDALGRTTKITDRNTNAETSILYDGLGREIERTDPNGTVIKTALSAGGLPESIVVTPADVTVQAAGRQLSGIGGVRFENFEYDALGRTIRARTNEQAEVRFVYDGLDRAVEETQIFRSYGQRMRRRFATDATWREVDYPEITGRPTVRYSYDLLGRTEQVEVGNETIATYSYTGADRVFRKVTGNGVETRYGFDDDTRATQIRILSPAGANGASGAAIWNTSARFNGPRPSSITEALYVPAGGIAPRNLTTEMRHDRAGRVLFSATEAYTLPQQALDVADHRSISISAYQRGRLMSSVDYVTDGLGKVQTIKLDSFTYGPGSRVASVLSSGSAQANANLLADDMQRARQLAEGASGAITRNQNFLYDNNGNVLYDGRFVYAYDYKGRLVRVEDTWHPYNYDDNLTFYYDSFDRRVFLSPDRDRVPQGLVRFGPEWDRHSQWHLYDGNKLIAETWVNHPRAAQPVTLLARYFFGAREGERLRMDRKPERDPRGPVSTFYFHEDLQGQIRLLTNGGAQPTVARNVDAGAGSGEAPTRPPEDAMMIAGTTVRMPYSSGAARIDGFAATVYREDVGRALISYRAAHAWGREVEAQLLRDAIASYQNRMLAVMGGIAAIPIAAPYAVAYVGGKALITSAIIGGTVNLGLNAGTAVYTQSGYSLSEGVGNFASGAISGMTGSVANAAAKGIVQEVLFDYAANVAFDTYSTAVIDGQSWKDAFASGVVSGAYSSALGFGVARVGNGLHWSGRQVSARMNAHSGMIRPDAPRGTEGVPARVYKADYINEQTSASVRRTDLYLAKDIVPVGRELKNFEMQVISLLMRGTDVSKEIARRLMNGTLEVRVSKFVEDGAYAQYHLDTPNLLHVNSGLAMIDPRTGARFNALQSPLMFAGLLVHEGIHALGGGELTAHTGQAKFLTAHVNRPARRGSRTSQMDQPMLDSGHLDLIHTWKEQSITKMAEFIAGLEADKGRFWYDPKHVRVTDYNSGDAWVRSHAGGWAEVLGLQNDTLFTAIEAKTRVSGGRFKQGVNLGAMP